MITRYTWGPVYGPTNGKNLVKEYAGDRQSDRDAAWGLADAYAEAYSELLPCVSLEAREYIQPGMLAIVREEQTGRVSVWELLRLDVEADETGYYCSVCQGFVEIEGALDATGIFSRCCACGSYNLA